MKSKMVWKSLIISNAIIIFVTILITIGGNKALSVVAEKQVTVPQKCIVIDAGHGGIDGGATSYTGVLESKLNLDIALRLRDLMHLLGIPTVMTRQDEDSIHTEGESIASKKVSDLKNRVRIINETENAVLISIHQNYFNEQRYSGAQVFYASTNGSKELAKLMQISFVKALNPSSNRKAKLASGIYLMKNIRCPGVLIECGFISNPVEEQKLLTPAYQKKICCAIVSTVSSYLKMDHIT